MSPMQPVSVPSLRVWEGISSNRTKTLESRHQMKALKGNIIYTETMDHFSVYEGHYLLYDEGKVLGIEPELPDEIQLEEVKDYGQAIIIPSFIDLHIHAPQYMQMGLGLNLELIDWLNNYTFMLEGRFADVNYAKKVYPHFVEDLYKHGTLRSCIFATVHDESNRYLVQALKDRGLSAYVGKVNMNQNAPVSLIQTSERSLRETKDFIESYKDETLVKPIITPRFAPSCTKDLLDGLGSLSNTYDVPVQTHLSENKSEIDWVKELFPEAANYSDVYVQSNLYGNQKTLMAHCIYLNEEEIKLAKNDNVFLVHCPDSNLNLASGIMPLTNYIDQGINIGLGSDVGGGHQIGMNKAIAAAIQCSKIRYFMNNEERILTESEAFYLATKENGRFFGNVGSFEPGYSMDAIVIKSDNPLMETLTPNEELQRFIYCGGPSSIIDRYLEGNQI